MHLARQDQDLEELGTHVDRVGATANIINEELREQNRWRNRIVMSPRTNGKSFVVPSIHGRTSYFIWFMYNMWSFATWNEKNVSWNLWFVKCLTTFYQTVLTIAWPSAKDTLWNKNERFALLLYRMLTALDEDMDETTERMNFVMGRLGKLLKTKSEY